MTDSDRIASALEDIATELKKIRKTLEDSDLPELSRLLVPVLENSIRKPVA